MSGPNLNGRNLSGQRYQAHDLLWVDGGAVEVDGPWPDWADSAWMAAAPVVVRRDLRQAGRIPVGLRGRARNQRCKAWVAPDAVIRSVTPEALAESRASDMPRALATALDSVAAHLQGSALVWGPTGGAGFQLASALPVLRADSDLDLLVRAPQPFTADQADALAALLSSPPCRLDIQIETGRGGFALAEWLRGGRVMLKTGAGPQLCDDPWLAA